MTRKASNNSTFAVEFFELVDALPADEHAEYVALLHRMFAAVGYPSTWPGFAGASTLFQDRLVSEWHSWTLRDVEWVALGVGVVQ